MSGLSRYEKVVLLATAGFVLFTGGWFLSRNNTARPYEVTAAREETTQPPAQSAPAESQGEGRPDSLLEGEVIDLNTASAADLTRLPGIGEKRAQAIVDYRESSGPFQSVEELTEVKGIGEGILAQVYDYVTVGGPDSPAE